MLLSGQSLEVNDFRYHLKLAYEKKAEDNGSIKNIDKTSRIDMPSSSRKQWSHYLIENVFLSDNNYVAALVAIRLGLRDAIIDATIIYSLTYAVVIGLTWRDVEYNFLLVIWGVSYMVSASVLASIGWKLPQWVSPCTYSLFRSFTRYFCCRWAGSFLLHILRLYHRLYQ